MKQITIQEVRASLKFLGNTLVENFSDEELLDADFFHDLNIGNIRMVGLWVDLQRGRDIHLPVEVFKDMGRENTVGSFLKAANARLVDKNPPVVDENPQMPA